MRDARSILTLPAATLAAMLLAALPAGCGGESESADSGEPAQTLGVGDDAGSTSDATSGAVQQAREDARAATEAAGDQDPLADLSADTAEAALQSYLEACAAGEFRRAAEFCNPDSPGAQKLIQTAEGFEDASSDPATAGMDLRGLMTQGFDQATHTVVEEQEGRVTFEVTIPDKTPTRMDVVEMEGGWRVEPPESTGLPIA